MLNVKFKYVYELFSLQIGLSSDATVLTPNTESSCDLMTKTKSMSGNDDSTSLDLEWEDEEGIPSVSIYKSEMLTVTTILIVNLSFYKGKVV